MPDRTTNPAWIDADALLRFMTRDGAQEYAGLKYEPATPLHFSAAMRLAGMHEYQHQSDGRIFIRVGEVAVLQVRLAERDAEIARLAAELTASRDERIQGYLQPPISMDDIVREVTAAFAAEVARIMVDVDCRRKARVDPQPPKWPDACRHPNSCSGHRRCMYVGCRYDGVDIWPDIRAALAATDTLKRPAP